MLPGLILPSVLHAGGNVARDAQGFLFGEPFAFFEDGLEIASVDELHRKKVIAAVAARVDRGGDVGMGDRTLHLHFPQEGRDELLVAREGGREDFQGDRATKGDLFGEVDFAHTAFADLLEDVELSEGGAGADQFHRHGDGLAAAGTRDVLARVDHFRLNFGFAQRTEKLEQDLVHQPVRPPRTGKVRHETEVYSAASACSGNK